MSLSGFSSLERLNARLQSLKLSIEIEQLKLQIAILEVRQALIDHDLKFPSRVPKILIEGKKENSAGVEAEAGKSEDVPLKILETQDRALFLFADMHEFTQLSRHVSADELTRLLNKIYTDFFAIVKKIGAPVGIEIVKLTGDCIMLSAESKDARRKVEQALAMVNIALLFSNCAVQNPITHMPIRFRMGINVGPATKIEVSFKGAQGTLHTIDWFGEGVNKAARMESSGLPSQIQISEEAYELVKSRFNCSPCNHSVKSYGKPHTYFVLHAKSTADNPAQSHLFPAFQRPSYSSSTPTVPRGHDYQNEDQNEERKRAHSSELPRKKVV